MAKKNEKYSRELEQIKMLKSINAMLKASDIENVLLSNSAKDSETVSDGVVQEMMGRVSKERERNREILDIERMTAQSTRPERRTVAARPTGRARPIRTRKIAKSKRKALQKSKRRR